jgi:hypothetical protein
MEDLLNKQTSLGNVCLLFLKLARPAMEEMNALDLEVKTTTMAREDGRRFKITVNVEYLD